MTEDTVERCLHEKQNPYTMVSTELIMDESISPKARLILIYLLSLPPGSEIQHGHLPRKLGIGRESFDSGMKELLKNGYASRKLERVNNQFGSYTYKITEFKKQFTDEELKLYLRKGFSVQGTLT